MQQTILNHRYELEKKIGEGGMAVVYRGRDTRLNRPVAIKVLHRHYADDADFLNRFQHEAQAAALLTHPSIVNVYDVGQDGNWHYIVMEYVEGEDLKTVITREAPLSVSRAVAIAEAAAYGLDSAHRLGMIHRDIKPQNIIVTEDGHIRITDFGIAKSDFSTAMTQTGVTFGTADYISPEQARGQTVSPQSDIYSLGVTLYEMLGGRLPFSGDSAVSVATQHVNDDPPALRKLNPQVPTHLETLILRAMSKDPAERPASAREFGRLLHRFRDHAGQQTLAAAPVVAADPPPAIIQPRGAGSDQRASAAGNRGGFPPSPQPLPRAAHSNQQGCGMFVVGLIMLFLVLAVILVVGLNAIDPPRPVVDATETTSTATVAMVVFEDGTVVTVTSESSGTPTATEINGTSTPTPTPSPSGSPTPTPSPSGSPTPTPSPSPTERPLVEVPDIRNLSDVNARSTLIELQLTPVTTEPQYDDDITEGNVIEQQVDPGTEIRQGERITYTLSLGPRLIEVPDLVQVNLNFARAEAERLGLEVEVQEQPSRTVTEGFIINQRPNPGARIQRGETVFFTVSIGDKVRFPNAVGLLRPEPENLIANDGLTLEHVDEQGPDRLPNYLLYRPNEVVSAAVIDAFGNPQPVENGEYVPRNSKIVLGVRRP